MLVGQVTHREIGYLAAGRDDGSDAMLGSGVLVRELITRDLVDGYRLFLHPLLLGAGKRLFAELDRPRPLRLAGCTPTSTGVLMLEYDAE
ncbi:dihydrofolate reductase family protein [Micromonospora sp. DT4]|uniref:dihydrofolate reductase family protein n=1 Tax=Micromonospora sp. DT4 TaxID=3393438 RepID=UPI003CE9E116